MRHLRWILVAWLCASAAVGQEKTITLASTTSTQNSGLYAAILPAFQAATGIHVNVVAVGTGQALRIAQNGDADVLIVHHRPSEDAFVAAGYGIDRRDLMYNDFVIIGPSDDPASIRNAPNAAAALARIAAEGWLFISRGDDSGTHKRERELWTLAALQPSGAWYREIGAGMGAALNMAAVTDAYTLADRGTWLSFGNKRGLARLFSGDPTLRNPYGMIRVNPARHPHVAADDAKALADWLTSDTGQRAIAAFRVNEHQLFCPVAAAPRATGICPPDQVE